MDDATWIALEARVVHNPEKSQKRQRTASRPRNVQGQNRPENIRRERPSNKRLNIVLSKLARRHHDNWERRHFAQHYGALDDLYTERRHYAAKHGLYKQSDRSTAGCF